MKLSGESSFLSPEALIRYDCWKNFYRGAHWFFPRRVGDAKGSLLKMYR